MHSAHQHSQSGWCDGWLISGDYARLPRAEKRGEGCRGFCCSGLWGSDCRWHGRMRRAVKWSCTVQGWGAALGGSRSVLAVWRNQGSFLAWGHWRKQKREWPLWSVEAGTVFHCSPRSHGASPAATCPRTTPQRMVTLLTGKSCMKETEQVQWEWHQ